MNENVRGLLIVLAAIIILTATVLFLFRPDLSVWMIAAGGILLIAARITRKSDGLSLRIRRAMRLELFSALLITGSAWFMFMKEREWVALLLSAAVLQLYASFIISREEKKKAKENK